jgi:catalase
MNGYGSHTFKLINEDGQAVYCKVSHTYCRYRFWALNIIFLYLFSQFHLKTDQGIKNFDRHQADEMAKEDPDFSIRDLYSNIADGKYPSWTM